MTKAEFPKETDPRGAFVRQPSVFRNWIKADSSAEFAAEPGRYHLYVSLACPWAHRTVILRKLKKLEEAISMSVVDPIRDHKGWAFRQVDGAELDPINGFSYLSEAYKATDPSFKGRVTVPVLWDKKKQLIVSNESSEIVRMLNSEFNQYTDVSCDYYPSELHGEIDAVNERIYNTLNNGVYRCGFATTQSAYESALYPLFETMEWLEDRLGSNRYLIGQQITEADWRLFTTLVRFDAVYYSHFKCNIKRVVDYPNLWGYLRELYQLPGIADTVNMDHIKRHYYITHSSINPTKIVPQGPQLEFEQPHGREHR